MRKFIVSINGNSYEVEVEEVKNGGSNTMTSAAPVSATKEAPIAPPAPKAAPVPEAAKDAPAPKAPAAPSTGPVPSGALTITAPMPGTILSINVDAGDTVSKGQVLLILEAMKMENEIMAPREGKVVSIQVAKGASVNPGDVLIALE